MIFTNSKEFFTVCKELTTNVDKTCFKNLGNSYVAYPINDTMDFKGRFSLWILGRPSMQCEAESHKRRNLYLKTKFRHFKQFPNKLINNFSMHKIGFKIMF